MSYEAIITPIINVRPHPNADRLVLGTVAGYQVITSKDIKEGTLGVFFPSDGQLSKEMCYENNLYRHKYLNKDPEKRGFFEDNRRVRAQRLRGEPSLGFWAELEVLKFTGANLSRLKKGKTFTKLNGVLICNKYYTKATRTIRQGKKIKRHEWGFRPSSFPFFAQQQNIKKLRYMIDEIPEEAIISLSEKCHGTSGRTGYQLQERRGQWFFKAWNNTLGLLGLALQSNRWLHISGTRRAVLNPKKTVEKGFYSGRRFRSIIHKKIVNLGLAKGETIYYEIVGYDEEGDLIMGAHPIEDKELSQRYGSKMRYTYGCLPKQHKVLVYRITRTTPDGRVTELPIYQMLSRCRELGLEHVPQLSRPFIYDGNKDILFETCAGLAEGHSLLDTGHIREGVVIRVEAPGLQKCYKYKGDWFCELEGIAKNSDSFVDPEEVS